MGRRTEEEESSALLRDAERGEAKREKKSSRHRRRSRSRGGEEDDDAGMGGGQSLLTMRSALLTLAGCCVAARLAYRVKMDYFTDKLYEEDLDTAADFQKLVGGYDGEFYQIPTALSKGVGGAKPNEAFLYNFIHVPKTGGTYFTGVLRQVERNVNRGLPTVREGGGHEKLFDRSRSPFSEWAAYPIIDTTRNNFVSTRRHFENQNPPEWFGTDRLKVLYEAGGRMFAKGSYGMGLCELVDAPCLYLTVLRDPLERFLSHYKYSCLAGAEDRKIWNADMKRVGECRMTLIEWYDYLGGDDWIHLLAPGLGSQQDNQLSVAIKNLKSRCFVYILNEEFEDGLRRLKKYLPDFASLDETALSESTNMNATPDLDAKAEAFYMTMVNDGEQMKTIRARLRYQTALYNTAKKLYPSKWQTPFRAC